jgi:selenocysteine-specific elongation factor
VAPIAAHRLAPGSRGYARIHVDGDPVTALPGDRFVLRGFARNEQGGATLGGGIILDVAPPHRRRSDPQLLRDLERLARRDPDLDLCVRIERSGLAGTTLADLARETGQTDAELAERLQALCARQSVAVTGDRWYSTTALDALETRLEDSLDSFHAAQPLRPGMPTAALRGSLPDNVPPEGAGLALARLSARGAVLVDGDVVRRPDHRPELPPEQRAVADRALAALAEVGLEAPSLRDLAARLAVAEEKLRDLLAHLGREGRVVRAPGEIWFDADAVAALRERVRAHFAEHETLETPTYKAMIGTSRRTAVPLMELLDDERLTARRGDVRRLRKG